MNKAVKNIQTLIGIGSLMFMSSSVSAQQDTLSLLREFVQVCRSYQQPPLQLDLRYINTTNLILAPEDTSRFEAQFYNGTTGAYIRFGEMEQIVDDSVALIVSDQLKRMIVYNNAAPVKARIKTLMSMPLPDSTVAGLAQRYAAKALPIERNIAQIDLISRLIIPGTSWPREQISLQYNSESKEPVKVLMTKHSLVPISTADSAIFAANQATAGKLITIPDRGLFLVREQVSVFSFIRIEHAANVPSPVAIKDRIVKNAEGIYTPAKGYETFLMTHNN